MLRMFGVVDFIGQKLGRVLPVHAGSRAAPVALENLPDITFDLSFLTEPAPPELQDREIAADGDPAAEVGDITFDLSFLTEGRALSLIDQREAVHVEQAEVGNLQVGDNRERKERNLEEWFRERAAEVARCAAERYQSGANSFEGLKAY